jgi:hypothetical protein
MHTRIATGSDPNTDGLQPYTRVWGYSFRIRKGEKGRAYLGARLRRSARRWRGGVPALAQSSPPARRHRQERECREREAGVTEGMRVNGIHWRQIDLRPFIPNRTLVRSSGAFLALTFFSPRRPIWPRRGRRYMEISNISIRNQMSIFLKKIKMGGIVLKLIFPFHIYLKFLRRYMKWRPDFGALLGIVSMFDSSRGNNVPWILT